MYFFDPETLQVTVPVPVSGYGATEVGTRPGHQKTTLSRYLDNLFEGYGPGVGPTSTVKHHPPGSLHLQRFTKTTRGSGLCMSGPLDETTSEPVLSVRGVARPFTGVRTELEDHPMFE